eukprot:5217049-Pyramimonas_sp.AAC.1
MPAGAVSPPSACAVALAATATPTGGASAPSPLSSPPSTSGASAPRPMPTLAGPECADAAAEIDFDTSERYT